MSAALTLIGLALGFTIGVIWAAWYVEDEVEMGYLAGHVDGYGAALADLGEVSR